MAGTIGVIIGSLRKESFSRKIANFLVENPPVGHTLEIIEIGDLNMYNQDFDEQEAPDSYGPFREKVKSMKAIIFVTPEYNRSVPGVLKNAIDVGSRPYGESVWDGKPALVVSNSISGLSGFGANHHLRQSLVFLNMPTMPQPEVYLPSVQDFFDGNGKLTKSDTGDFLKDVLKSFVAFANR
ncbi:MAG: NADPH-dependent FMN reductase [Sphingobacterium sp.]|uniref:NADPH-dependent FMN reductase n=1 Tax=Sphingobacterium sp. JB170 TaxID=1434842 RepID=UPI00097F1453|nr:NAD(P)H-dependent oxidoreductase [Sphingobacterium sp. JB170]SJN49453.1 NADPH:quinone oxidoreductase [Sphingobacterium sp. JB170]